MKIYGENPGVNPAVSHGLLKFYICSSSYMYCAMAVCMQAFQKNIAYRENIPVYVSFANLNIKKCLTYTVLVISDKKVMHSVIRNNPKPTVPLMIPLLTLVSQNSSLHPANTTRMVIPVERNGIGSYHYFSG